MNYKYFYTDYCEDKEIPGTDPWEAELEQIIHSMDCVLHMPDNFIGIVNNKNQTVQFIVEKDNSVTIDIPIVQNGKYIESKQKNTTLAECLTLVRSLVGTEDFYQLLPSEQKSLGIPMPWWKIMVLKTLLKKLGLFNDTSEQIEIIDNTSIDNPRARLIKPSGNYIENLRNHPNVDIPALNYTKELKNLPVWISHPKTQDKPNTYENIFWCIESMGEYLYYCAGDYTKNEKGLLEFDTATMSFRVENNFEIDVVHVAKQELLEECSDTAYPINLDDSAKNILYEFQYAEPSPYDLILGYCDIEDCLPESARGKVQMTVRQNMQGTMLWGRIVYMEIREPADNREFERLTLIQAEFHESELPIANVIKHFISLVEEYANMPYHYVSGATRY